jgi:hypothetical protein
MEIAADSVALAPQSHFDDETKRLRRQQHKTTLPQLLTHDDWTAAPTLRSFMTGSSSISRRILAARRTFRPPFNRGTENQAAEAGKLWARAKAALFNDADIDLPPVEGLR